MQDADAELARIAEEDQKLIREIQAAFHKKVAQAEADYQRSVAAKLAQGRIGDAGPKASDRAHGRV